MEEPPVRLPAAQRSTVDAAIRETCRVRCWRLHALNVLSNHVHVVLAAGDRSPEQVMTSLKAWATRWLNDAADRIARKRWWTRHGSTRYLHSAGAIRRAAAYVRNQ